MNRKNLLTAAHVLCGVLIAVEVNILTDKPSLLVGIALAITVGVELFLVLESRDTQPPGSKARLRARPRLLAKVRHSWVDELQKSLFNIARIDLGLEISGNSDDWLFAVSVQEAGAAERILSRSDSIEAIFDARSDRGGLLLLGAPGSGKTTMLLNLADKLLARAADDADQPIPVVFNLSSWAAKRDSLDSWMIRELEVYYEEPRQFAKAWMDAEEILPLLDGLDEVPEVHRVACIEAINAYQTERFSQLVVCSRMDDYERLTARLQLSATVKILPLSRTHVDEYLESYRQVFGDLRSALAADETLWELLDNPLMLNITMLAKLRPDDFGGLQGPVPVRRIRIFAKYVDAMFDRRGKSSAFQRQETMRWLPWLARAMESRSLTEFRLEALDEDWLDTPLYGRALRFGLQALGLCISLWVADSVAFYLWSHGFDLGSLGALGFFGISFVAIAPMAPADRITWSPTRSGAIAGLGFLAVYYATIRFPNADWLHVLLMGVLISISIWAIWGIQREEMTVRSTPNGGTSRSGWLTLIVCTITTAWGSLAMVLIYSYVDFQLIREVPSMIFEPLGVGAVVGALFGAWSSLYQCGFAFFFRHWVVRCLLWFSGHAPLPYVAFLNSCEERIFLRRVGGSYVFVHRMLRDYFASLAPHTGDQNVTDGRNAPAGSL